MTPSTQPTPSHSQHIQNLPSQSYWEVHQVTLPVSNKLPFSQSFLTPHPRHILSSLSDGPDHFFPTEVSHECPARRPAWYTRPQACFTREKSDRPRATEFCEKGGKGMFGLPPSQSKISCQIPPTNHSFVPSLSFSFFLHTNMFHIPRSTFLVWWGDCGLWLVKAERDQGT